MCISLSIYMCIYIYIYVYIYIFFHSNTLDYTGMPPVSVNKYTQFA